MRRFGRVLVLLVVAACEKKAPEPPSGLPPLPGGAADTTPGLAPSTGAPDPAGPHGLPAGHPGMTSGGALPSGHPSLGGAPGAAGGLPAGHPALPADTRIEGNTPGGTFDPRSAVGGELQIPAELKAKATAGDVIFLVARTDDGTEKGSILAVKKLAVGAWPLPFQLDGRDAMNPGTQLAGKVLLTARVDKDGDAISKNPGDLVGVAHVTVPSTSVRLGIDRELK